MRGSRVNPAAPGLLYVVVHEGHRALKWGIANSEKRLAQHQSQGWSVLRRWEFAKAGDAWTAERAVKNWVRSQGVPVALSREHMRYRGHTETAWLHDVSAEAVIAYIETLVGLPAEPPRS